MSKKVTLELVGINGNAFALMGAFSQQARKEGWTKEEIKVVTDKCMKGNYDELLCTLMDVCESPEEDDDENEIEFEDDDDKWRGRFFKKNGSEVVVEAMSEVSGIVHVAGGNYELDKTYNHLWPFGDKNIWTEVTEGGF